MNWYYLAILLVFAWSIRFVRDGINEAYISRAGSSAIKGLFILMVFVSHANQYIGLENPIGQWLGQMVVALFLFYSGYGVMESIQCKGHDYVKTFSRRRILTTLLNFDIAVLVFVLLNMALGNRLGLRQVCLSFLAWDSVGNSNWYIFAILYCYCVSWIMAAASRWFVRQTFIVIVGSAVLFGFYILVVQKFQGRCWIDTILCYWAGVVYSVARLRVESFIRARWWRWFVAMAVSIAGYFIFKHFPLTLKGLVDNLMAISFCLVVVFLTMRFKVGNPFLRWCGDHLFPLYIYQRVPMIAFAAVLSVQSHPHCFIILSFGIALLLAGGYRFIALKLN